MRALHALEDLKTFFTFFCKNFPGKITDKYIENLKQAFGEILAQERPQKFVSKILCCVALVYNSYFFQNSRFTEVTRH